MEFRRQWLLVLCLFHCLALADYVHKGCYDTRGLNLRSQSQHDWQSLSNCQQHCGGSPLVAMRNGGECFCGDSLDLLSSASLTPGLCNTQCNGWAYQSCGGNSSVDVYVDASRSSHSHGSASVSQVALTTTLTSGSSSQVSNINSGSSDSSFVSSSLASSTSEPSASGSSQSSSFATSYHHVSSSSLSPVKARVSNPTASQTIQTTPVSISGSPSISTGYVTRVVSTLITRDNKDETVLRTTTALELPSSYSNIDKSTSPKNGNLGGGAIAGIVVGVVLGVLVILAGAGFYLWRRHVLNQEPDLEETKHYQPYSFGDADAMSIDSPSRTGSTCHKGSSATRSSSYGSVPTGFLSDSISKGSLNSLLMTEDTGVNHMRQNMPSTVFEEPPSVYNGSQRFSTGSLPDMMEERNLTVANPDGENNRYSQRKFDDVDEVDEENMFSAGSSGGSYYDQEPKSY
ncbi:ZYRO0B06820p [Zygosaccharomyces rouxii]|uniref:ZYRO0B06820p n=1 Tax=Zygosaccharomyces rouxii (strain ATCC 2623 / CBS 732 / NBRC 1130 / NCYC 568 / NRRL Y-229) TaxID=559307 RepID=C5DRA5_ZYGRC|nr:uncharacterized protein ZYRO0B06820g [Zygosaccharomyces rouxii]KAH9200140.1 hypothetical protein LQ764DRAFT_225046 [Zygosaccharomyces rouxii]CAR26316.1 ZYRO0B06820p [Zygosaccharomyces rouxii]